MMGNNRKAKAGGSAEQIRFGLGQTSIAALLVAVGPAGVVAIIISEHPDVDAQIAELKRRLTFGSGMASITMSFPRRSFRSRRRGHEG